jgi:putative hydrolase of the HAD superfamily
VQSVVFDLFHTLVDPEGFRPTGFHRAEKIADIFHLDRQRFREYWEATKHERCTNRSKKTLDYVLEYVSKANGIAPGKGDVIMAELILGRYQDLAIEKPRQQVKDAVLALRDSGIKLGLLTNADEREARKWPGSPLAMLFDASCFSFSIGYEKPEKEAYTAILQKLRAAAENSIYVGDGGSDELRGAKEAGFGLVVFMNGFVSKNGLRTQAELEQFERTADVTVSSLSDLIPIIAQINLA